MTRRFRCTPFTLRFVLLVGNGIHFVTVTKWQTRSKTKPHEIRTFVQRAKPLVSVSPPRLAAVQVDFNSPTAEFMPCCCSSCSEYWSSSRRRSLYGSGIVTHTAALALLNARAVRAAKQLYCSVVRQLAFRYVCVLGCTMEVTTSCFMTKVRSLLLKS